MDAPIAEQQYAARSDAAPQKRFSLLNAVNFKQDEPPADLDVQGRADSIKLAQRRLSVARAESQGSDKAPAHSRFYVAPVKLQRLTSAAESMARGVKTLMRRASSSSAQVGRAIRGSIVALTATSSSSSEQTGDAIPPEQDKPQ
ncbi:hypothetical protein WJX81_001572 [Elliptochloris bilobata]|uniref:Uncharacterized protein n=1 Tax=Elliptochloris bilobata TaxID=381761 RepID=A0AAW1RG13_9CHLO